MKTLVLSGVSLSCLALLIAVIRAGAGTVVDAPAITTRPSAPDVAQPVQPASATAPEVARRKVAEWLPDGHLWIRVTNATHEPVVHVLSGWGSLTARRVRADAAPEISGDWLRIAERDRGEDLVLFVSAPGHRSAILSDLTTDRRHEVALSAAATVTARVRDIDTSGPVAEAVVCVSREPCSCADEPGDWIAGVDTSNAIYTGRSGEDGQIAFDLPHDDAVTPEFGDRKYDAQHSTYLTTALIGEGLALSRSAPVPIDMQMPVVGAIQYVNGSIYQSSVGVARGPGPEDVPLSVRDRLAALKMHLAQEPRTVALALLPYRKFFHGSVPKVHARVTLRRGGIRSDEMVMQRLDRFTGPQLVDCDPNAPELVMARVVFRSPGQLGDLANADGLDVLIAGSRSFGPKPAKLGETVDLPVGSYRLCFRCAWSNALADDTFVVRDGSDHVFQVRWRTDTKVYVIDVVGPPIGALTQLLCRSKDFRSILDARIDERGRATFWTQRSLDGGDLYVRGLMEEPVVFTHGPEPNHFHARCVVTRVRKQ